LHKQELLFTSINLSFHIVSSAEVTKTAFNNAVDPRLGLDRLLLLVENQMGVYIYIGDTIAASERSRGRQIGGRFRFILGESSRALTSKKNIETQRASRERRPRGG
jgi:hypothetical protein